MNPRSLQIFAEQVKLVYGGALSAHVATVFNACLLAYLLRHVIALPTLLGWLAFMVGLTLLRWLLVQRYRRAPGGPEDAIRWNQLYTIGTTLSGLGWGTGGILLFAPGSIAHQLFLVFVLGGMVTAAVAVLPARMECFLSFFFPALTPILLRFFLLGDEMHLAMGVMGSLFMAALYLAARRVHRTILSSLRLRFENDDLIAGLRAEIAHRRDTEDALRESEEQYRSLIHATRDVIFTLNPDGLVASLNPAFELLTGWARSEWVGRSFVPLLHPDDVPRARTSFQELLNGGVSAMFELRVRTKAGDYRTGEFTLTVKHKAGQTVKVLGIARDVTERKGLEAQLRVAQKMEAVGQLAGGIAHEFNNLLQIIKGYCSLLRLGHQPQDAMRHDLEAIEQSADRAAELTRQLLAFSRPQHGVPRVLDLNALLRKQHRMLERVVGQGILLKLELAPELGHIKADPDQITQVLLNLVNNARDAMPRGGRLTLGTANLVVDGPHTGLPTGDYVSLTVRDSGCGIAPDIQGRIFEPFFTTKEVGRGTGLGLSTVYGVVTHCGGQIRVQSAPGQGATFTIVLPRTAEPLPALEAGLAQQVPANGSGTVLLVEDEAGVRKLLRTALESWGYQVLEAPDGLEAVRLGQQYRGPIHLLLTDVVMPGLSGRDLADRLLPSHPHMKVLFVSGYAGDAIGRYGVADSGAIFLQKPFSPQTLLQKVRELLKSQPGN